MTGAFEYSQGNFFDIDDVEFVSITDDGDVVIHTHSGHEIKVDENYVRSMINE